MHSQELGRQDIKDVRSGELRNDILQAVGRINVRRCVGDQAPKADVYLIASDNAGRSVDDLLRDTFPGCKVVRFSPPGAPLQNWERVLKIVKEFFAGGKARVSNGLELLTRIWSAPLWVDR